MDLEALIPLAPGQTDALDRFLGTCLTNAGLWRSPRTSDGLHAIDRILDRSPSRLRVCGRIWSMDQVLHTFWLDLQLTPAGLVSWRLYFDPATSSPRRARNAVHDHHDPEAISWHTTLTGSAALRDGALLPSAQPS